MYNQHYDISADGFELLWRYFSTKKASKAIFSQDVDLSVFKPECFTASISFDSMSMLCLYLYLSSFVSHFCQINLCKYKCKCMLCLVKTSLFCISCWCCMLGCLNGFIIQVIQTVKGVSLKAVHFVHNSVMYTIVFCVMLYVDFLYFIWCKIV